MPVLVNWPVTNGTLLPTMILASSLSSVTRFGVDVMLVLAWRLQEPGDRRQAVGAEEVVDQADVEALRRAPRAPSVAPLAPAPLVIAEQVAGGAEVGAADDDVVAAVAADQALPLEAEVGGRCSPVTSTIRLSM